VEIGKQIAVTAAMAREDGKLSVKKVVTDINK